MRDSRSAVVAAAGIVLCTALGWLSHGTYGPPRPVGESAPAEAFSAARAGEVVESLAAAPRTMGSAAHTEARRGLVERFEAMGLETTLEEATVLRARGGGLLGARVVNLLARLRGTGEREGAILLMAHYDTVPGSPGAGDDASGVAAIVEAVRALTAGPPLARDVLVLLTDGEEAGLLGARAFVREQERLADVALVLNFEARGSGGAVSMFETSAGNHRMVEELGRAAPYPVASSLSYEVYRRMPNDTDFSVLRRAGAAGLNFAMIGRHPSYHTRLDNVARLAPGSLQHHGTYALALTRHYASLEEMPVAGADGVYFNLVGRRGFVSYSSNTARVLTIILALVAAAALTVRSRHHHGRVTGAGLGAVLFVGAAVSGWVAAIVVWRGLALLAPGLRQAPHGIPWIAPWLAFAGVLLTLALVVAILRLLTGLAEAADLWAGVLVAWTIAAVVTSFFLVGGSYVFLWPALAGWVGLLAAEKLSGSRRWRAVVAMAAAAPAILLLSPLVGQFFEALTIRQAGPALALAAWLATLLVVPLAELATWGRSWIETGLAVAALGVLVATSLTAGPGSARPATSELFYLLDSDRGEAFWMSGDRRPSDWVGGYVEAGAEPESVRDVLPSYRRPVRRGAATAVELAPPTATFERVEGSPGRAMVRIASPRGAAVVHLHLAAERSFRIVAIDGELPPSSYLSATDGAATELGLTFLAPPPEGLALEIEPGEGRLELRLADQTYGLPQIDGETPRRPPGLIPPAGWTTDSTVVSRRIVRPEPPPGAPDEAPEGSEPEAP